MPASNLPLRTVPTAAGFLAFLLLPGATLRAWGSARSTKRVAAAATQAKKAASSPSPSSLTCDQVRIVQDFGEATYTLMIRDGVHNNSPAPIQFSLKSGQSKVVEQNNCNPFSLVKDNVIEMQVNAATPPNPDSDLRDRVNLACC